MQREQHTEELVELRLRVNALQRAKEAEPTGMASVFLGVWDGGLCWFVLLFVFGDVEKGDWGSHGPIGQHI